MIGFTQLDKDAGYLEWLAMDLEQDNQGTWNPRTVARFLREIAQRFRDTPRTGNPILTYGEQGIDQAANLQPKSP